MNGWLLFLGAAILGLTVLLIQGRIAKQHEEMYKQRMKGSMLYYEIYPLIQEAHRHDLDRVIIERSRIAFYAVCPPGEVGSYLLSDYGHRPLNPDRVWALAQLIADEFPLLREKGCYRFRRFVITRPNGQKDDAYQFIIRTPYKTDLMYARQRKPQLY
ncbi:MAG: hypothetical protein J5472_01200 [Clostridia bacterium]|nr:hypothetical protein [Clostridia bacterium]